jgi:rhodanese-related sulfurtransferase
MAPPLAGSMHLRWWTFLWLDAAGSMLYIGAYFIVGFLCSDAVAGVIHFYERFGQLTTAVLLILLTAYAVWLAWSAWKAHGLGKLVPHAPAAIVAHDVGAGDAVVFDVRSHGYFDPGALRIPGSTRVDPNALRANLEKFSKDRQIYLYCTCQRQATAVRVARELLKLGLKVAVIKDGLGGWRAAGLKLETVPPTDVAVLPFFT